MLTGPEVYLDLFSGTAIISSVCMLKDGNTKDFFSNAVIL